MDVYFFFVEFTVMYFVAVFVENAYDFMLLKVSLVSIFLLIIMENPIVCIIIYIRVGGRFHFRGFEKWLT